VFSSIIQVMMGLLAVYHLGIGVVSVSSIHWTAKVTGRLYAIRVKEDPQLSYAIKMLGLYALTLGGLYAYAASHLVSARPIVVAAIFLQMMRGAFRLIFWKHVTGAFEISPTRNATFAILILMGAALLAFCLLAGGA